MHGHKHLGMFCLVLYVHVVVYTNHLLLRRLCLPADCLVCADAKFRLGCANGSLIFTNLHLIVKYKCRHQPGLLGEHAHSDLPMDAAVPAQELPGTGPGDRDLRHGAD